MQACIQNLLPSGPALFLLLHYNDRSCWRVVGLCVKWLTTAHTWWDAVRQVQLSKEGAPQAILSNRTAWLYHSGLASWLCLADSAFASSPFTSLLPLNPALQGTRLSPSPVLVPLPGTAVCHCILTPVD